MMLPEIQDRIAKVAPIIAEVPVASPSMPSVRLLPLETAVMTNITTSTNNTQAYFPQAGFSHSTMPR